jgi:hypothetical protein
MRTDAAAAHCLGSIAGVAYSELRSAATRLGEVDGLQRPLLCVLEKEQLADKLAPLLVKHHVRAHQIQHTEGMALRVHGALTIEPDTAIATPASGEISRGVCWLAADRPREDPRVVQCSGSEATS